MRELEQVCFLIAQQTALGGATDTEVFALAADLHVMSFRGIVISIAGLAYHCLGFDPGCKRPAALKLMRHLREGGPASRRDLQRKFPAFSAAGRDKVLERLAAEGLVTLDGNSVAAVPLADFVRGLHTRPEFPEPKYHWPELPDQPDQADNTKS